jgi:hypothetical protein
VSPGSNTFSKEENELFEMQFRSLQLHASDIILSSRLFSGYWTPLGGGYLSLILKKK